MSSKQNPTPTPTSKPKPKPKRKRKLVVRKKVTPPPQPPSPSPPPSPPPNLENQYLEQLSETEKIALKIAHQQLESSFCLEKSIGFLNFKEKI